MYGYIYITTNLINDRKYIGQHKCEIFDINYKGSGKILKQAFIKYGIDNFKCEILKECDSKKELDESERYFIEYYDAVNSDEFYNLVPGGNGRSETGLIYITNGEINKKVHFEELEYYYSLGFHKGGPTQTEQTKIKRANANRGKKHPTAGAKISASLIGKKLSEEHKKKISESKKDKEVISRRKLILCVETNTYYKGLKDATKSCGGKTTSAICNAIKNHKCVYGYHWKYVDEVNENTPNSENII